MNKLSYSLSIIILVFLIGCGNSEITNTIQINDYRTIEQPTINLENHKKGDVEVNRILMPDGESYEMNYFHDYTGKLGNYRAYYSSPQDFDKAIYNWDNDTSITFTLINSETDSSYTLHLFGNGATSGLRIDD